MSPTAIAGRLSREHVQLPATQRRADRESVALQTVVTGGRTGGPKHGHECHPQRPIMGSPQPQLSPALERLPPEPRAGV